MIAFQNIVPISLYISIEIVKTIQAFFISQDFDMYYQPLQAGCTPKTWNISDDLGQIEYVFSDKTGTLTQNVMEFQKCSVNGIAYGEGVTEAQRGATKRVGGELLDPEEQDDLLRRLKEDMLTRMTRAFKNRYLQPQKLTLISPQLADDLADTASEQRGHLIAFFRALAICHSVLSDRPEPHEQPYRLEYKAESPDEAALVAAARDVGFPFVQKTREGLDIEVMGQPERYQLLQLIEFNSTRKRMSVLVRNPQGQVILYTKGADSVIYERLTADHDPELKAKTSRDMEAFANGGLRTLCIAYRYVSEEEYTRWQSVYDAATTSADRDTEIDKANAMIEHSLTILGATALEDKLQEGVPEAIETLHQAGIKLWILTGDKIQTAIEIGEHYERYTVTMINCRFRLQLQPSEERHGDHDPLGGRYCFCSISDRSWNQQDRVHAGSPIGQQAARLHRRRASSLRRCHRRGYVASRPLSGAQRLVPESHHTVRDRRLLPCVSRTESAGCQASQGGPERYDIVNWRRCE